MFRYIVHVMAHDSVVTVWSSATLLCLGFGGAHLPLISSIFLVLEELCLKTLFPSPAVGHSS